MLSSAHLRDPTPDSIKHAAAKLIFLKAQLLRVCLLPNISRSKRFKGSSCSMKGEIVWTLQPGIQNSQSSGIGFTLIATFRLVLLGSSRWIISPFAGGAIFFYGHDFDHLSHLPLKNPFSKVVQILPHLKYVMISLGPLAQPQWFIW